MQQINRLSKSTSRERLQSLQTQQQQISNAFRISNFYNQHQFDLPKLKHLLQQVKLNQSTQNTRYQSLHHPLTTYPNHTKPIKTLTTNHPQPKFTPSQNIRLRSGYSTFEDPLSTRLKHKNHPKLHLPPQIVVSKQEQLNKFEIEIQTIWAHYQLLTKIIQAVQSFPFSEQISIIKYVNDVGSSKFQFIIDFLDRIHPRYHKTIILSRLLENISIVYLVIHLSKQKKIKSATNLVNFVGFCTSNLIFLIRLYTMHHQLKLSPSNYLNHILSSIDQFQLQTYKTILKSEKEVIIRMQHNNETINIIQIKLTLNSTKQLQIFVEQFLKHVERNQQQLFEYAHYIFQFLAYWFHKEKTIGIMPYLEIAPAPYLTLKFPQTIIIEPWQVLFFLKNNKLYIRAHTQHFIQQLSYICNVVIWSDMMPLQADPLVNLLPKRNNIYSLYRYHCKHQNNNYLKLISRVGCLKDNAIIIDRNKDNFIYDKDVGIQLPWKGQKRDTKLLSLLELISPLFNNGKTLTTQIVKIRKQLEMLKKKSRTLRKRKYQ